MLAAWERVYGVSVVTLSKPHSSDKSEYSNIPKVLHICSDFAKQHIYAQLVTHLTINGISQLVYCPVRSAAEAEWVPLELSDIEYYVRNILRPHHRLLFKTKIRKVFRDLCAQVDLSQVGLIHAHFLYSDGAVALKLKKQYNIPYIVAVRNTDINIFMRYRPDLCWLANDILRYASQVVFMSPAYRTMFLERLDEPLRTAIEQKSIVIPSGVRPFWLKSHTLSSRQADNTLRLLYVGDFSKNKNIPGLLQAVALLFTKRAVHLTLVGGGGGGAAEVQKLLDSNNYKFATQLGRITDTEHLQAVYRNHDLFVMPSFTETFGVVYIEALSQGLPIIHSRGQGVDGYFESGTVSEAVDPADPANIAQKIEVLAARCHSIRQDCIEQAKKFDWGRIAETYKLLYRSSRINDFERK